MLVLTENRSPRYYYCQSDQGENTRRLLNKVARTLARPSALCSRMPSCTSKSSMEASVSLNTQATSRTFSTKLRVWSGAVVWTVMSAASSARLWRSCRQLARLLGNSCLVAESVALFTSNFEAVTSCRASLVRTSFAAWKRVSSIFAPPPAAWALEHCATTWSRRSRSPTMVMSALEHSVSLLCCDDTELLEKMWPFLNMLPDPGLFWLFTSASPFRHGLCWVLLRRTSWKKSKVVYIYAESEWLGTLPSSEMWWYLATRQDGVISQNKVIFFLNSY